MVHSRFLLLATLAACAFTATAQTATITYPPTLPININDAVSQCRSGQLVATYVTIWTNADGSLGGDITWGPLDEMGNVDTGGVPCIFIDLTMPSTASIPPMPIGLTGVISQ